MEKYIEFKNITKIFPGQRALNDVSFGVKQGEIHALLGENGAGKSTLLNILFGTLQATEGQILIDGKTIEIHSAGQAIQHGISKVHQEISVIAELSVAENIMLGAELTKGCFLDREQMFKKTDEILKALRCNFSAKEKMKYLSTGHKQMVQIAKALFTNAKIIAFDEPTSSISDAEVKVLFEIINELKEKGITILYISHKLDEIFKICDRASVLRDGTYITTLEIAKTTKDDLIKSMVGRDVSMFAKRHRPSRVEEKVVLEASNLTGEEFENINFKLKKGEILGFFGLVGAGRTEVMKGMFGANEVFSGTASINGKVLCKNPKNSIVSKLAYISENRKEEGFVKNLNNGDNIALAALDKFKKGIFIDKNKKYENAVSVGKIVGLSPNDPEFMTFNLSGGNAQKVILAKWLSTDADVVIFDEPTKGIDIGAKADIYKMMEDMVEDGKSIIMVSSELTEIIGMSDRIIIMKEGQITAELSNEELEESDILKFAVGVSE